MFRFLLYVKRVQLELQQCWAMQMRRRHVRASKTELRNSTRWLLRNHMAFLVDNLQYYLQVGSKQSWQPLLEGGLNQVSSVEEIASSPKRNRKNGGGH